MVDPVGCFFVGHQVGVEAGEGDFGFTHHLRHVGEYRVEEGPGFVEFPETGQAVVGVFSGGVDPLVEGGAHAIPAGKHDAGLGPGEDPGDSPQVGDGGGLFAGCWSGSDVEVADFGQGGGGGEVFDEAGVVVDQVGVFGLAEVGDFSHDGVGLLRVGLPLFDFEEGCFDGGGDEGFEVAAGGFRGAVFR